MNISRISSLITTNSFLSISMKYSHFSLQTHLHLNFHGFSCFNLQIHLHWISMNLHIFPLQMHCSEFPWIFISSHYKCIFMNLHEFHISHYKFISVKFNAFSRFPLEICGSECPWMFMFPISNSFKWIFMDFPHFSLQIHCSEFPWILLQNEWNFQWIVPISPCNDSDLFFQFCDFKS
jgi:hypothetical protein